MMYAATQLARTTNRDGQNRGGTLARGLMVVCSLLLGACSSLPTDVQRTPSSALAPDYDTVLGREIKPMLDAHPELSGFHTLGEGEQAFAMRLRMIESAQNSLDLQYYIWHADLTGRAMYSRLLDAADRGVRVRILLDDLDTAGKDTMLRRIDAHPNLEIRLFNPFANRDNRAGDFLTDTTRVNHRMHNKTLTADNLATIFGGRNIGDEYFAATEDVGFGDMDALALGPIAQEVSSQFDLYWNSQWVYPLTAFEAEEPVTEDEVLAFRKELDRDTQQAQDSRYAEVLRELGMADINELSNLDLQWSRWILAYDQPSKVEAREIGAGTHLAPRLKKGMDQTREELIIVSPYFVPGDEFTAYLTGLVDRGVRVRILTNSLGANDVSLVHAGYMRYREDLVAGGVELYEFKASASPRERKKNKRIGASRASLHAKFFGFDQQYLFIGSFNLDARSVALNTELGAYYKSPAQAARLSRLFDTEIMDIAYRVELDEKGDLRWRTRTDGEEISLEKEPDTTAWKRFTTRFLSIIVPESQL